MRKIVSLFKKDYSNKECPAYDEYEEDAEFVLRGEYKATQKFDGTACLIKDGKFYKRYHKKKENDTEFIHWSFNPEQKTGHGWTPVTNDAGDQYHREAFHSRYKDGTYELCGEKVQGNPEKIKGHILLKHGLVSWFHIPIDFEGLKDWLKPKDIEGIVFHGINGEMIKIKKSDFGLPRVPVK